jgi:hypothetical protein
VLLLPCASPTPALLQVGYYWYKKVKKQCEAAGGCQMGGFTRLLHTGQPDDLMDEIPTWVAQPLPAEHPDHGWAAAGWVCGAASLEAWAGAARGLLRVLVGSRAVLVCWRRPFGHVCGLATAAAAAWRLARLACLKPSRSSPVAPTLPSPSCPHTLTLP